MRFFVPTHVLVVVIVLFIVNSLLGQSVAWVQQSTSISDPGMRTYKLETDSQNNNYVLFLLFGQAEIGGQVFTSTATGKINLLLVKFDPDGSLIWSQQFETGGASFGAGIAIDPSDNVLVTGSSISGSIVFGQTVSANFIAKLDTNGSLLWLKEYGDANTGLRDIQSDAFGNVIVAGQTAANVDAVIKYDPLGNFLWATEVNYLSCCIGLAGTVLKVDHQNNIIWGGSLLGRFSFDGATPIRVDDTSVFFWKLDMDGNTMWLRIHNSTGPFFGDFDISGIDIDLNNDIYVTGHFTRIAHFGTFQLNQSAGNNAGYLAKLSAAGTFVWAKPIYTGEIYIYGLTVNHTSHEINVHGEAINNIRYDNFSALNVRPGFILTTSLAGDFTSYLGLEAEIGIVEILALRFSTLNEMIVLGNFISKVKIGCFEVSEVTGIRASFLYKTSTLPDVYFTTPAKVCIGTEFDITVEGTTSTTPFKWELSAELEAVGGLLETVGNSIRISATELNDQAYIFVRPTSSCYTDVSYRASLSIIGIPAQPAVPTGDVLVCPNTTSIYAITEVATADNYIWDISGGLSTDPIPSANPYEIKLAMTGVPIGSVRAKARNQCGESLYSETLQIDTHPPPPSATVAGPRVICLGESQVNYVASAQGIQSYGWVIPKEIGINALNTDSAQVMLDMSKVNEPTTIFALAKGICANAKSDPFLIGLINKPDPPNKIEGPEEVCHGDEAVQFESTTSQPDTQFEWKAPKGFKQTNGQDGTVYFDISDDAASGIMEARVLNSCFISEPSVLPIAVLRMPGIPEISYAKCQNILTYGDDLDFVWLLDDEPLNDLDLHLTPLDSGYYKLRVTNSCGSTDSKPIQIFPLIRDQIFVPNVITPDGNGKNDFFIIDKSLSGSSIDIYNRWGKSVYHSTTYDDSWMGGDLSAGTYYYQITNECIRLRGIVQLVK